VRKAHEENPDSNWGISDCCMLNRLRDLEAAKYRSKRTLLAYALVLARGNHRLGHHRYSYRDWLAVLRDGKIG
jgi:hypothetical protein